jgi:hypothetical protein
MTRWRDVEQAEPEFAQRVRRLFEAHEHKTIATVRADGSPRISGIEAAFEDGELVFGSMPVGAAPTTPRLLPGRKSSSNGRPERSLDAKEPGVS